jgi:hypothetical protein
MPERVVIMRTSILDDFGIDKRIRRWATLLVDDPTHPFPLIVVELDSFLELGGLFEAGQSLELLFGLQFKHLVHFLAFLLPVNGFAVHHLIGGSGIR